MRRFNIIIHFIMHTRCALSKLTKNGTFTIYYSKSFCTQYSRRVKAFVIETLFLCLQGQIVHSIDCTLTGMHIGSLLKQRKSNEFASFLLKWSSRESDLQRFARKIACQCSRLVLCLSGENVKNYFASITIDRFSWVQRIQQLEHPLSCWFNVLRFGVTEILTPIYIEDASIWRTHQRELNF